MHGKSIHKDLFWVLLIAFCGVVLMSFMDLVISHEYRFLLSQVFWLIALVCCWSSGLLRGENIGYPIRIISVIWFVIYCLGSSKWFLLGNDNAVFVSFYSAFALLSLCSGYIIGNVVYWRHRQANTSRHLTNFQVRIGSAVTRAQIVLAASFVATLVFIAVGGFPAFRADALTYRLEVRDRVSSYVLFMLRSGQVYLYLYLSVLFFQRKFIGRQRLKAVSLISFVLFVNYIPGWRNPLMFISMTVLFIYALSKNSIRALPVLASAFVSVLLILVAGFFRLFNLADGQEVASVEYFNRLGSTKLEIFFLWASSQFSNYSFGFLTAIDIFPSKVNYLFGGVLPTTLYTILPGKQELLDEKLKRWSGLDFDGAGLNLTLLGESYADFGWYGVLIYPLLYGLILGVLIGRVNYMRSPARVAQAAFVSSAICLGSVTGLLSLSQFWIIGLLMFWVTEGEQVITDRDGPAV